MKFTELGLDEKVIEAIGYMGYDEATPIQELAIPIITQGKDLIACAQTGTGKTAAFLLPILHNMYRNGPGKGTQTLVVCPTRELAVQIEQAVQGFAYFLGINSIAIYGGGSGSDWETQKKALSKGADIIVATPGKLISLLNMGYTEFKKLKYFILDESDRMMDMGFIDDIKKIASHLPKERQTLMFSATMPSKIRKLSAELLKEPEHINIAISKPAAGVLQAVYLVHDNQKVNLLCKLIRDKPSYESIIVFTSRKKYVNEIVQALKRNKLNAAGISSDYDQDVRMQVLKDFKSRTTRILVATDVMSRGIDIKEINLVVNFDCPKSAEDYVHRVGRTARASNTGVALTFINQDDMYSFKQIEDTIESEVPKVPLPEEVGKGPAWDPTYKKQSGRGGRGGGGRRHGGHKGGKGRSGGGKRYSKGGPKSGGGGGQKRTNSKGPAPKS